MPGLDNQTLNNPYLSHAGNRLLDTKQPMLIFMPGIDNQTLNNQC